MALFSSLLITLFKTHVSSLNYPGAIAIERFNSMNINSTIHIDAYSAQKGISLYNYRPSVTYNKSELLIHYDDFKNSGIDYFIHSFDDYKEHFGTSVDVLDVVFGLERVDKVSIDVYKSRLLHCWFDFNDCRILDLFPAVIVETEKVAILKKKR